MASNPFEIRSEEDPVPSYEESVTSPPKSSGGDTKHIQPAGQPLSLPNQLANTRTQRIESILSTYVDPLLLAQGASGLYKTTFILIPSTVSTLQDAVSNAYTTPEEPQVVGFPSNEVVKLVRLNGEEHAMEFWRQPAVLAELESSLKARLVASGHRLHDPSSDSHGQRPSLTPTSESRDAAVETPKTSKKSFWSRAKEHATRSSDVEVVDRKLGWRSPSTDDSPSRIPTGLVNVSLVWKEVCLRIANEMGLYESKRGPGLCITVEVGS